METDINKLDWNPHTCSCQIEITREDTTLVGHEEFAYSEKRGGKPVREGRRARIVLRGGQMQVSVPRYRTKKRDKGAVVSDVVHEIGAEPPPGMRLRGTVTAPCPVHAGFSGVVQTQRYYPDFCRCVFLELIIGERKEGGFFGATVEKVCHDHAKRIFTGTLALKDLRDTVLAEAKAARQ